MLRLKWIGPRRSTQNRKLGRSPTPRPHPESSSATRNQSTKGRVPGSKIGCTRGIPSPSLREGPDAPLYRVRLLDRNCPKARLISIKSSLRWIDTYKTPNGGLSVPYIDRLGKFTGTTLYRWSCDPRSLLTTVVATIHQRIESYAMRHNPAHVVLRLRKALFSAAAYYAFSKNAHFWDRVLFFCRDLQKRGSLIHRLRLFFSSKWDDDKRFVYSQVIFQTNWLLSRASRSMPRDKSLFYRHGSRPWSFRPESVPSRASLTNTVRDLAYAISGV